MSTAAVGAACERQKIGQVFRFEHEDASGDSVVAVIGVVGHTSRPNEPGVALVMKSRQQMSRKESSG
jgi:hypothetical protein